MASARLAERVQMIGGVLIVAIALVITVALLLAPHTTAPTLTDSYPSIQALINRSLSALANNDPATLHALRLTRFEHDSLLVPAMNNGKSRLAADLDFAWFLLDQNNLKGIRRAVADYGGSQLQLEKITFERPSDVYGRYTLHRGIRVTVRDVNTSEEFILPIFGTVIEEDGHFKLVSIRD